MKFYGELLIFILLFITNARILFVKKARRDPLVSLAPLSFLLSILFILAWKIDFITLLCFIISLIVLLSNFHALFRYTEHLYVDHYSVLMKVWAFFTMILSGAAIAGVIYFHPIEQESKNLGITEIETHLNGSFRSGFEEVTGMKKTNAAIYEYTLVPDASVRKEVILFVPDKRGDTINYSPYLQFLCKEGFTVFSGDFYTADCKWTHSLEDSKLLRRISLTVHSLINNQNFMSQREFYTYNIKLELTTMVDFITQKYGEGCKIYLVSDVMGNTACQDFMAANPSRITGFFAIDSVSEYKTPGYGFVAQTDPVTALLLNVQRDDDYVLTKAVVQKTVMEIKKNIGIKTE